MHVDKADILDIHRKGRKELQIAETQKLNWYASSS
jgi:hypothetical protein